MTAPTGSSLWCNWWPVSDLSETACCRPLEKRRDTNLGIQRRPSGSFLFKRVCAWELQVMGHFPNFEVWWWKQAVKTLKHYSFTVAGLQIMLVDIMHSTQRCCGFVPENLSDSRWWRAWCTTLSLATWPATPSTISLNTSLLQRRMKRPLKTPQTFQTNSFFCLLCAGIFQRFTNAAKQENNVIFLHHIVHVIRTNTHTHKKNDCVTTKTPNSFCYYVLNIFCYVSWSTWATTPSNKLAIL